jgi:hypothetical protein
MESILGEMELGRRASTWNSGAMAMEVKAVSSPARLPWVYIHESRVCRVSCGQMCLACAPMPSRVSVSPMPSWISTTLPQQQVFFSFT